MIEPTIIVIPNLDLFLGFALFYMVFFLIVYLFKKP